MSLKKALATLLATVMMLSLVSCGSKSNEEAPGDASKPTESAESSGKIKVGFSSAAFSDEWCHTLALAFENLPATEYPEIEATVLDGNIDAEKQINTIQSLMQQGMDYIAVQPLPGTEPALQEVVDAGVPLFCVDMVPTRSESQSAAPGKMLNTTRRRANSTQNMESSIFTFAWRIFFIITKNTRSDTIISTARSTVVIVSLLR